MRKLVISSFLFFCLTSWANASPVAKNANFSLQSRPVSLTQNCDAFAIFCGQIVPFCGCGCSVAASDQNQCFKTYKDSGLLEGCAQRGYCIGDGVISPPA